MKYVQLLFYLFIGSHSISQIQFIGFDRSTCSEPMTNSYSYTNYSSGGGGSGTLYGFTVYKNGIAVYGQSGTMGDGKSCVDLKFVNDSVGFIVTYSGNSSNTVWRTADYGQTWSLIGGGAPNYFGLYVINAETAYLVTQWDFPMQLYVAKCSANAGESNGTFIYDQTITADIFKTDTVFASDLCGIDTLAIYLLNGVDTVTYHINFLTMSNSIDSEVFNQENDSFVFPNPATNYFSLNQPLEDYLSVRLYSMNGSSVKLFNNKSISDNYFSLEGLTDGVYFLEITSKDNHSMMQKLLILGQNH
jgi:hypothetical protein